MGNNSTLFHSEFGGEWCLYFKRNPELLTAVSSLTGKKGESINCTRLRRVFYRSSRYPSFSSPWGKRYRMSGMSRSQLRKTETWGPWTLGCLLPGVDLSVGRTAALRGRTGQTEYLLMYLSSAHPKKNGDFFCHSVTFILIILVSNRGQKAKWVTGNWALEVTPACSQVLAWLFSFGNSAQCAVWIDENSDPMGSPGCSCTLCVLEPLTTKYVPDACWRIITSEWWLSGWMRGELGYWHIGVGRKEFFGILEALILLWTNWVCKLKSLFWIR